MVLFCHQICANDESSVRSAFAFDLQFSIFPVGLPSISFSFNYTTKFIGFLILKLLGSLERLSFKMPTRESYLFYISIIYIFKF
jgi:hypothetical protein